MKLTFAFHVSTIATMVSMVCMANNVAGQAAAVYTPMYQFNKGKLENGKSCSSIEWSRIESAFVMPLSANAPRHYVRRTQYGYVPPPPSGTGPYGAYTNPNQYGYVPPPLSGTNPYGGAYNPNPYVPPPLPGSTGTTGTTSLPSQGPKTTVARNCMGGSGYCIAAVAQGCGNQNSTMAGNTTSQCSAGIAAIDAALNAMKGSFSPSCRALIDSPRTVTCVENSMDCDVIDFTVIAPTNVTNPVDASNYNVVAKLNATGTSTVCSRRGPLSVIVNTKFEVGAVNMTIRSVGFSTTPTHSMVETARPHALFGKKPVMDTLVSSTRVTLDPYYYNSGPLRPAMTYTLEAFSPSDRAGGKSVTFTISAC